MKVENNVKSHKIIKNAFISQMICIPIHLNDGLTVHCLEYD